MRVKVENLKVICIFLLSDKKKKKKKIPIISRCLILKLIGCHKITSDTDTVTFNIRYLKTYTHVLFTKEEFKTISLLQYDFMTMADVSTVLTLFPPVEVKILV